MSRVIVSSTQLRAETPSGGGANSASPDENSKALVASDGVNKNWQRCRTVYIQKAEERDGVEVFLSDNDLKKLKKSDHYYEIPTKDIHGQGQSTRYTIESLLEAIRKSKLELDNGTKPQRLKFQLNEYMTEFSRELQQTYILLSGSVGNETVEERVWTDRNTNLITDCTVEFQPERFSCNCKSATALLTVTNNSPVEVLAYASSEVKPINGNSPIPSLDHNKKDEKVDLPQNFDVKKGLIIPSGRVGEFVLSLPRYTENGQASGTCDWQAWAWCQAADEEKPEKYFKISATNMVDGIKWNECSLGKNLAVALTLTTLAALLILTWLLFFSTKFTTTGFQ